MCNCVIITSTMKKPHSSPELKNKKNTSLSLISGCSQAHLQGGQGQNKELQGQTHSEPAPCTQQAGMCQQSPSQDSVSQFHLHSW